MELNARTSFGRMELKNGADILSFFNFNEQIYELNHIFVNMNKDFLSDRGDKISSTMRGALRQCIINGSSSIAAFSRVLNISVPTATKIVADLIDSGFLLEEGKLGTAGGRKPSIFGLNSSAGYFLGVDVARQHFHIAVTDFRGQEVMFIQDIAFVLEANAQSFHNMCELIKAEVTRAGIPWTKILGAGISLSGRVNPEKGYSFSYFLSDELPIKDQFEKELKLPVSLENDSRAMTYGEYLSLGADSDPDMIFINVSFGLGMGIITDGRLYYGRSGFSGEIGHFPLLNNDILCRCGKVGCLETGASGLALQRIITEKLKSGRRSSLSPRYKEKGELDLDDILKAVEEEDVLAIEGVEQIGETLGKGIAGIINIFNPGLVVIGGRLTVGKDYLMLPVKTAVNKYSLSKVSKDTKLRFSRLGRKAASIGDCLLSRSKVLGII